MSMETHKPEWTRWLVALMLGALMSTAIWLVGAHEVAFVGFLLAALAGEQRRPRSCWPRPPRRSAS